MCIFQNIYLILKVQLLAFLLTNQQIECLSLKKLQSLHGIGNVGTRIGRHVYRRGNWLLKLQNWNTFYLYYSFLATSAIKFLTYILTILTRACQIQAHHYRLEWCPSKSKMYFVMSIHPYTCIIRVVWCKIISQDLETWILDPRFHLHFLISLLWKYLWPLKMYNTTTQCK